MEHTKLCWTETTSRRLVSWFPSESLFSLLLSSAAADPSGKTTAWSSLWVYKHVTDCFREPQTRANLFGYVRAKKVNYMVLARILKISSESREVLGVSFVIFDVLFFLYIEFNAAVQRPIWVLWLTSSASKRAMKLCCFDSVTNILVKSINWLVL